MEDIGFNFALDQDGNFYNSDSDDNDEVYDPIKLAVALYSKHLKMRASNTDGRESKERYIF